MNGHKGCPRPSWGCPRLCETDRQTPFVSRTNLFSPLSWGFGAATARYQPSPKGAASQLSWTRTRLGEEAASLWGLRTHPSQAGRRGRSRSSVAGPGCSTLQEGRAAGVLSGREAQEVGTGVDRWGQQVWAVRSDPRAVV